MKGFASVICLLVFLGLAAAQTTGNDQLRQAINAALNAWITSGDASTSWAKWYGSGLPYNQDQLTGCTGTYPAAADVISTGTLGQVISRGVLHIGSDFPSPPLYFTQGGSSEVVGFDQDFANYLTAQLTSRYGNGKTITSDRVYTAFSQLLPNLNNNTYDVASGGMFATAERKLLANFACNISIGGLSGIVANISAFPNIDAINKAGVRVGALTGTTQYTLATQAGATVTPVTNADEAYPLLLNGTIDAWLGASTTLAYWTQGKTDVFTIPVWGPTGGVAWAIRFESQTSTTGVATTNSASALSAGILVVISLIAALF